MNLSRSVVLAAGLFLTFQPLARAQQAIDPNQYVKQLYRFILEREPSRGEIDLWANNIRRGTPPEDVRAAFLGSDEFFRKQNRNPFRFVNALSLQIFGRPTTEPEYQVLAGRLTALGGNRTSLALEMIREASRPAPPPQVVFRLPSEPVPVQQPNVEIVAQAEATIVLVDLFFSEIDRCRDPESLSAVRNDARRLQASLHKLRRGAAAGINRGELRLILRDTNDDWRVLRERRHALNVAIPTLRIPSLEDVNDGMERTGQLVRQLD